MQKKSTEAIGNLAELKEKINNLRTELNNLIDKKGTSVNPPEIVGLSQELDRLIVQFIRIRCK